MRRYLIVAALIAAGLVCVRLFLSARPRVLAVLDGSARSRLAMSGRWLVWLESDEQESRLMIVPRRGGRSRAVLRSPRLSGLAVGDDTAYVSRSPGPGGRRAGLLAVSLRTGAAKALAELPEEADEIVCSGRWIAWRRLRQPSLSGIPFLAAAAPMTAIRATPVEGGSINIVAVLRGEASSRSEDIRLLGVTGDSVYWHERHRARPADQTLIRHASCAGAGTETVVTEAGSRSAALAGDVLAWTAPSLEAGSPSSFAAVKRMVLGRPGFQVIADWLDPGVMPMLTATGRAYAQERGSLWRLGDRREAQRRLFTGPTQVVSPVVSDHEQFMFLRRRSQTVVAKRPLSLWARVRSLSEW